MNRASTSKHELSRVRVWSLLSATFRVFRPASPKQLAAKAGVFRGPLLVLCP